MPRLGRRGRARKRNLKLAEQRKEEIHRPISETTKLQGRQFTYAVIVHGIGYRAAADVFLENNILPPSETCYYNYVDEVISAIVSIAKESCVYWRSQIRPGTVLSFDGSWDHRRNGRYCIVDAVDLTNKKIVGVAVLQRSTKAHPTTYHGSAQNMEVQCCRDLARELGPIQNIVGYCHDNDSAVRNVFKKECPRWTEFLDPNHTVKSFERHFVACNKATHGKLDEIKGSLVRFMYFLIDYPVRPETKVTLWRNTENHFRGDHSQCPGVHESAVWRYSNDPEALAGLRDLLGKTEFIIRACVKPYSTQLNEAYHAIKSHVLDKEKAWRATTTGRLYLALLIFNNVDSWMEKLRERLQLPPLDLAVLKRMRAAHTKREGLLAARRNTEFQRKERLRRATEKKNRRRLDTSGYLGRPRPE